MLETILQTIADLPSITFEEYFTKYVMSVQDTNIDDEIRFICNHNFLDVNAMIRLSSSIQKELESIGK